MEAVFSHGFYWEVHVALTWDIHVALDWTVIGAIVTTTIGLFRFLRDYGLKARAEQRLAESARIENQIKLLKVFAELMNLANARAGSQLSEKAVEILLQRRTEDSDTRKILADAVVVMPVGEATQDAAIAAIFELGRSHDILKQTAIRALESLGSFKPLAAHYLSELRKPTLQGDRESGGG